MRRLALTALVALALPAAHAQDAGRADRADRAGRADRPTREAMAERHLDRIRQRLDLNEQQAAVLEQAFEQREPGALWVAAAALAPTLTDEQRTRLTAMPERPERPDRVRRAERVEGERPDRARRGDRRTPRDPDAEWPAHAEREEDFEAVKSARDAALGLSADQAAALERIEAEHREAWEERRARRDAAPSDAQPPAPGAERRPRAGVPGEVAEILSDEQETIWLVHRALSSRLRGGPGGGPVGPATDLR